MSLAAWLIILAWISVAIIFGLWVYEDARRRGEPALEWFLVVLIGSIAGAALYFLYRQSTPEARWGLASAPAPPYPFGANTPPPPPARSPQDPRTAPLPRCPRCGAAAGFSDMHCGTCGLPLR